MDLDAKTVADSARDELATGDEPVDRLRRHSEMLRDLRDCEELWQLSHRDLLGQDR